MNKYPCWTIQNFKKQLNKLGFDVGPSFIYVTLKKWHWNLKTPSYSQLQKYSSENIYKYVNHVLGMLKVISYVNLLNI